MLCCKTVLCQNLAWDNIYVDFVVVCVISRCSEITLCDSNKNHLVCTDGCPELTHEYKAQLFLF